MSNKELIKRVRDQARNLSAEIRMCEFKHNDPDCAECEQAKERLSVFTDCLQQMELDRSEILQYQLEVSALKAEIDEYYCEDRERP